MSRTSHESPKRRCPDDRCNDRSPHNPTLNQFGEYDDIDIFSIRSKSKPKTHRNLEFLCHVHNSDCGATTSPFPSRHGNLLIGTGSTAQTSKAEDSSLFESFANEMRGMENYANDMSPMLPESSDKPKSVKVNPSAYTPDEMSQHSPVSSISAASPPSSFYLEGPSGVYNHNPSASSGRTHSLHCSETVAAAPLGHTQTAPSSPTFTSKTGVQLFFQESPVRSGCSPDWLEGPSEVLVEDPLSAPPGDGPKCRTVARLFAASPDTPSGNRRRTQTLYAQNGHSCSEGLELVTRVEQSTDYFSDMEEDEGGAASPTPEQWLLSRPLGGAMGQRGTPQRDEGLCQSSEDFFLQGTPGRLDSSWSRRCQAGHDDSLGRLFDSGGDISPVSMTISFDSAPTRSHDNLSRSTLMSPARCFGVGGHSLFCDLIRAASTGAEARSDDSDTCDDDPPTCCRGQGSNHLGKFVPARSRQVTGIGGCDYEGDTLMQSLHGSSFYGASNPATADRGSAVRLGRRAFPGHPDKRASPPGMSSSNGRHLTSRSLPTMAIGARSAADTPMRPTHRLVQRSTVPCRDTCSTSRAGTTTVTTSSILVQKPVVQMSCRSSGEVTSSSLRRSHVRGDSSPFEQLLPTPKTSHDKRPSSAHTPTRSPDTAGADKRWVNGRSRSTSFGQVSTSPPSHAVHNQTEYGEGLPSSPSRFMEQRHCCRVPAERISSDTFIEGGGEEGGLGVGGSKRSRSPRCVSPRYGSSLAPPEPSASHDSAGHGGNGCDDQNGSYSFSRPLDMSYASSLDSTSCRRPLPDQSAFDPSHLNTSTQSSASHASPVCPPTPDRVPHWLHDASAYPCDVDGVEHNEGGIPSGNVFGSNVDSMKPAPMRRLNSLVDTKILLSSVSSDNEHIGSDGGAGNMPLEHDAHRTGDGVADDVDNHRGGANGHCSVDNIVLNRDFINEGLMGSGTFAEVFRVSLKADPQQTYAVKKSRRKFRSRKDRENLLNEVRIMQVVGAESCQHIIQFYRAWQEDSFFYVQLELAERGTLRDLMVVFASQRRRMDSTTVMRVIHDVAAGLEHIHACHVVHLDIKPANILIGLDGTLKIGDFGIAMLEGGGADEAHEGDTRYLPEELLNSSERHPSADMFSLGLTLYEVCLVPELDVLPYGGSLWHDLREGRAVDLSLPTQGGRQEDLCALIAACMSPHPDNRPSAAGILHHPCVISLDLSQPCLELCEANVGAPSPIVFRTNSFCPIGPSTCDTSSGFSVDAACSRPRDDDSGRMLFTPHMGASHLSRFFRMLSPPTAVTSGVAPDSVEVVQYDPHVSYACDEMEEDIHNSDHQQSRCSSRAEKCSTPSTHVDTPRGHNKFWPLRTTTPLAHQSGPSSTAAPAPARASDNVTSTPSFSAQQLPSELCSISGPASAAVPQHRPTASPRTNAKKKLSGGRPHGPIRKVKK